MALRNLLVIIFLGCYLGKVLAFILPLQDDEGNLSLASQPGGDIIALPYQMEADKSAIMNKQELWPGGVIAYKFDPTWSKLKDDPNFSTEFSLNQVRLAMDAISTVTCITFREAKEGEFFVNIKPNLETRSCSANVGRAGIGRGRTSTVMNLTPLAFCIGDPMAIVHEFIHAIGFWHEQQRPDRDEYITVHLENWDTVTNGDPSPNFGIAPNTYTLTTYDYKSIMHYGPNRGAKKGTSLFDTNPKYFPKTGGYVDQLYYITQTDSEKINALYKDECPQK